MKRGSLGGWSVAFGLWDALSQASFWLRYGSMRGSLGSWIGVNRSIIGSKCIG